MYRNAELRRYQYYVNPNWSGMYPLFVPISLLSKVTSIKAVFMQARVYQALGENPFSAFTCHLKFLSSPGALIAATWAVMQYIGDE